VEIRRESFDSETAALADSFDADLETGGTRGA